MNRIRDSPVTGSYFSYQNYMQYREEEQMSEKCLVNPEQECFGRIKALEVEGDVNDLRKRNETSHKEFFDRLAVLERHEAIQTEQYKSIMEKLSSVTASLSELAVESKTITSMILPLTHRVDELEEDCKKLKTDVTGLKEKPAKRWENMVEKVLALVVAAVVGFLLSRIGLG